MKTHSLKTWPSYWLAVKRGDKTFEVRRNDRDFAVGDLLLLRMWDPHARPERVVGVKGDYVTREGGEPCLETEAATIVVRVTYILHGEVFGGWDGYCIMGIKEAT